MNRFTNIINSITALLIEQQIQQPPLYPTFPEVGTVSEKRSNHAKAYNRYVEELKEWADNNTSNVLLWRKLNDMDGDRLYMLSPNVSGENGEGWRVTIYTNDEYTDGYQPIGHSEEPTKFDAILKHDISSDNVEFLDKFPE